MQRGYVGTLYLDHLQRFLRHAVGFFLPSSCAQEGGCNHAGFLQNGGENCVTN